MAFDLDKVIAEQPKTSTRKKAFTFTLGADTYTLPKELDLLALSKASSGDLLGTLERLLGPAQFAKLVASPTILTLPVLTELLGAYYDQMTNGLTVGESAASSRSSKSTARPSKRTSTTTTRKGRSKR